MSKKILFVVTSNGKLGDTGGPTGFQLHEAAALCEVLVDNGYAVDFVSPAGEHAPIDPGSMDRDDPTNRRFLEEAKSGIDNTIKLEHVDASGYDAVCFPGGHGAVWEGPAGKRKGARDREADLRQE